MRACTRRILRALLLGGAGTGRVPAIEALLLGGPVRGGPLLRLIRRSDLRRGRALCLRGGGASASMACNAARRSPTCASACCTLTRCKATARCASERRPSSSATLAREVATMSSYCPDFAPA
jgi:hypothetical protein